MDLKPPSTYDEQIVIFKSRHLVIKNDKIARRILSHVSYYRLSPYGIGLNQNNIFYDDISIEHLYKLYLFDSKLRHKVFEMIEYIEIHLRNAIAYSLAFHYGSEAYLNVNCFTSIEQFARFACNFYNTKQHNKSLIISHYNKNYDGKIPIWAVVETFTFGTLSKLYSNLLPLLQKDIAAAFPKGSSNYIIGYNYLKGWIKSLVELRNICAHFDRIYNRIFLSPPKLYKEHIKLGIDNRRFFAYLLVIGRLTYSGVRWNIFIKDISALIKKYDVANLKYMGFPANWEKTLYQIKNYKIK